MRRANFAGEYVLKDEVVSRPVVTINRTGTGIADKEKDLICCANCGAIESWMASFCMGCGARFVKVKDIKLYAQYEEELKAAASDYQLTFEDVMKGENE